MKKQIKRWFRNLLYKAIGLKVGGLMIHFRNGYLYIDCYGNLWLIEPTFDREIPLQIEIFVKADDY